MTESELIDEILASLHGHYDIGLLDDKTFLIYGPTIKKMRAYNLIEETGNYNRLLEKGYQVIEVGGFEKWTAENKKREHQLHQATISSVKAAWITAILTAIPIVWGIYQYVDAQSKQKEINALKSERQSLLRQLQAQKASHIETPVRVDSLPTLQKLKK